MSASALHAADLDAFDREGFLVLERAITSAQTAELREAILPLCHHQGRNNFEGFNSQRVYALLGKAPETVAPLVAHPVALGVAERDLGATCLLSACLAINLLPGESVQGWHTDDGNIRLPRPHPPFGVSAFWALDDTTAENGATWVVPGSHRWSDADVPAAFRQPEDNSRVRPVDEDPAPWPDAVQVELPAGSVMLTKGALWHRGGANRTVRPRLIVTPQYCAGWARQLETMLLAVPPDVARDLPARVQDLLGYSIHGAFMGYVDGRRPRP